MISLAQMMLVLMTKVTEAGEPIQLQTKSDVKLSKPKNKQSSNRVNKQTDNCTLAARVIAAFNTRADTDLDL